MVPSAHVLQLITASYSGSRACDIFYLPWAPERIQLIQIYINKINLEKRERSEVEQVGKLGRAGRRW